MSYSDKMKVLPYPTHRQVRDEDQELTGLRYSCAETGNHASISIHTNAKIGFVYS